jgi:SAM-dependent methyltransferase
LRYGTNFYASQSGGSARSAEKVIPLVIRLLKPRSILDVGCGVGSWLRVARDNGVDDVMGIDGQWAQKVGLVIPESQFQDYDLSTPIDLGRRFDLVLTLEVAEHIAAARSDTFVDTLCRHADTILFSAALPGQGGRMHLNEQPLSYWVDKFSRRNYGVIDALRPYIWNDADIGPCYRQNMVLFAIPERVPAIEAAARSELGESRWSLDVAHPQLLKERANYIALSRGQRVRFAAKLLVSAIHDSYRFSV